PSVPTSCHPLTSFLTVPPPTDTYTLSLHDALPILSPTTRRGRRRGRPRPGRLTAPCSINCSNAVASCRCPGVSTKVIGLPPPSRSEEHTSELQSPYDLVCRLLLEKKKTKLVIRSTR